MSFDGWKLKSKERMDEIREESIAVWRFADDEASLSSFADFFKGFGDETRLKIIALLWDHDLCMCEITSALDAAASTVSHHLRILEKGDVISSRREGKFTIYTLNKQLAVPVLKLMKEGVYNV